MIRKRYLELFDIYRVAKHMHTPEIGTTENISGNEEPPSLAINFCTRVRNVSVRIRRRIKKNASGSRSTNGQSAVRASPSPANYWQIGGGHACNGDWRRQRHKRTNGYCRLFQLRGVNSYINATFGKLSLWIKMISCLPDTENSM